MITSLYEYRHGTCFFLSGYTWCKREVDDLLMVLAVLMRRSNFADRVLMFVYVLVV
jgi:hypothetical protein